MFYVLTRIAREDNGTKNNEKNNMLNRKSTIIAMMFEDECNLPIYCVAMYFFCVKDAGSSSDRKSL